MSRKRPTGELLFADAFASAEPEPAAPATFTRYADVALNRPVRCEFTYGVPAELLDLAKAGSRAVVHLGVRLEVGVVTRVREEPASTRRDQAARRPCSADPRSDPRAHALDHIPRIRRLATALPGAFKAEHTSRTVAVVRIADGRGPEDLARLEKKEEKQHRMLRTLLEIEGAIEVRDLCRRLQVSDAVVATLARKGLVVVERRAAKLDPLLGAFDPRPRPESLSADQSAALDAIGAAVRAREHRTFLLQGVTGSGKTEVYLRAIEVALELGRGAIVLVPEIALTPRPWAGSARASATSPSSTAACRTRRRGPGSASNARSSARRRRRALDRVRPRSEARRDRRRRGARALLQAGQRPRYHRRDVAAARARIQGAVCILGSATPSLETWQAAREGRIARLLLRERVGGDGSRR
jgi:primosomal protein N' (replication factor Y)